MIWARYPPMVVVEHVADDILKMTWRRVETKGHFLIRIHAILCDDSAIPLARLVYGNVVEGRLHIDSQHQIPFGGLLQDSGAVRHGMQRELDSLIELDEVTTESVVLLSLTVPHYDHR